MDEGFEAEIDQLHEYQKIQDIDFVEGFDLVDLNEQLQAEFAARSNNESSFDHIRSLPAGDFLRSVDQWYREAKDVPGQ